MKPIYWYATLSVKVYKHTTSRRVCDKCFKPAEGKITSHSKYEKETQKLCSVCLEKLVKERLKDEIKQWAKEIDDEEREADSGE